MQMAFKKERLRTLSVDGLCGFRSRHSDQGQRARMDSGPQDQPFEVRDMPGSAQRALGVLSLLT